MIICKTTDKLKYAIISIHFFLTFLLERLFFTDNFADIVTSNAVQDNIISLGAEKVITYITAKFFSLCIIFLFYSLIFSILQKKVKKSTLAVFVPVFLLRFLLDIIFWDVIFSQEYDNYITLTHAVSNMPYYWHHIFTSALFEGALMFFPHVAVIPFLQGLAFSAAVALAFEKLENIGTRAKIITIIILLLLPHTDPLSSNPYRNCLYTILCIFYFTYIISLSLQKKPSSAARRAVVMLLSVLLSIWRSEGFVLGFFGLMYYCIFVDDGIFVLNKKSSIKPLNIAACLAVFLCLFYVFSLPQKLGTKKYSGSDYIFTSLIPITSDVLDSPYVDVSYENAANDLTAIDKICPVFLIQSKGLGGYWEYNLSCGRGLTESGAADEDANSFKNAVISLILHNTRPYLLSRINMFLKAADAPITLKDVISAPTPQAPQEWLENTVKHMNSYVNFPFSSQLIQSGARQYIEYLLMNIISAYKAIWKNAGLNFAVFMLILFTDIFIVLRGIAELIKKQPEHLRFTLLSGLFLGELAIVVLVMPDSRSAYLMPLITSKKKKTIK